MKRLLFLLLVCIIPLGISAQRLHHIDSINTGATDTVSYDIGTGADNMFGGPWSYQLNYQTFDAADATISLYWSNEHPDSASYVLLWVDQNLDGTNDNPWTLSDNTNGRFLVWGTVFPAKYFIRVLTRVSVSDSTSAYEYIWRE